jgi:DNA-binding NtrC family response regulator
MELRGKGYKKERVIFRSKKMKQLMSLLCKIASVDSTVLILGESGVGKEVIARELHELSIKARPGRHAWETATRTTFSA